MTVPPESDIPVHLVTDHVCSARTGFVHQSENQTTPVWSKYFQIEENSNEIARILIVVLGSIF